MQLINELAYIIELDRPKSFNEILVPGSKIYLLYNLITRRNKSEAEAAQIIYQSSVKDKRYLMLKGNLIKKLTDLVMVSDTGFEETCYLKTELGCERRLLIAKKLLQLNVFHNARRILKKVERDALDFHLSGILTKTYTLFRKIAALKPDPQAAMSYQEHVDRYLSEQVIEQKAKGYHEVILSEVKSNRSASQSTIDLAHNAESVILEAGVTNPYITSSLMRIRCMRLFVENDWQQLNDAVSAIERHFAAHPYVVTTQMLLEIYLHKVRMTSYCKQFEACQEWLLLAYQKADYQTFDIFDFKSEEFDLTIRSGRYDQAGLVLKEVLQSEQFDLLNPVDRAQWRVKEAFLYFVAQANPVLMTHVKTFGNHYSLQDFMLETAPLTKDKYGFNLQYITAKVLLLITQHADVFDESNNIKTYYHRYLKQSDMIRTKLFFKTLSKILKQTDQGKRLEILHQFNDEILDCTASYDFCELMPYEIVLDMLLKVGSTKKVFHVDE